MTNHETNSFMHYEFKLVLPDGKLHDLVACPTTPHGKPFDCRNCRNPEARHRMFGAFITEGHLKPKNREASSNKTPLNEDVKAATPKVSAILRLHAAAFNARNSRCDAGAGGAGAAFPGACCGVPKACACYSLRPIHQIFRKNLCARDLLVASSAYN